MKKTDPQTVFLRIPKATDIWCYTLKIEANCFEDGSLSSDKLSLYCYIRQVLERNANALVAPSAANINEILVLLPKVDFIDILHLPLNIVKRDRTDNNLYQFCLSFTFAILLAPLWQPIGTNWIYGFLSSTNFLPSVSVDFGIGHETLVMTLRCARVQLPPLLDLQLDRDVYVSQGNARASGQAYVLPKLRQCSVVSLWNTLPENNPFINYQQLRQYWQIMHGIDLPQDGVGMEYAQVRFQKSKTLYTYPLMCLAGSRPIKRPMRVKDTDPRHTFLLCVVDRVKSICGTPIRLCNADGSIRGLLPELDVRLSSPESSVPCGRNRGEKSRSPKVTSRSFTPSSSAHSTTALSRNFNGQNVSSICGCSVIYPHNAAPSAAMDTAWNSVSPGALPLGSLGDMHAAETSFVMPTSPAVTMNPPHYSNLLYASAMSAQQWGAPNMDVSTSYTPMNLVPDASKFESSFLPATAYSKNDGYSVSAAVSTYTWPDSYDSTTNEGFAEETVLPNTGMVPTYPFAGFPSYYPSAFQPYSSDSVYPTLPTMTSEQPMLYQGLHFPASNSTVPYYDAGTTMVLPGAGVSYVHAPAETVPVNESPPLVVPNMYPTSHEAGNMINQAPKDVTVIKETGMFKSCTQTNSSYATVHESPSRMREYSSTMTENRCEDSFGSTLNSIRAEKEYSELCSLSKASDNTANVNTLSSKTENENLANSKNPPNFSSVFNTPFPLSTPRIFNQSVNPTVTATENELMRSSEYDNLFKRPIRSSKESEKLFKPPNELVVSHGAEGITAFEAKRVTAFQTLSGALNGQSFESANLLKNNIDIPVPNSMSLLKSSQQAVNMTNDTKFVPRFAAKKVAQVSSCSKAAVVNNLSHLTASNPAPKSNAEDAQTSSTSTVSVTSNITANTASESETKEISIPTKDSQSCDSRSLLQPLKKDATVAKATKFIPVFTTRNSGSYPSECKSLLKPLIKEANLRKVAKFKPLFSAKNASCLTSNAAIDKPGAKTSLKNNIKAVSSSGTSTGKKTVKLFKRAVKPKESHTSEHIETTIVHDAFTKPPVVPKKLPRAQKNKPKPDQSISLTNPPAKMIEAPCPVKCVPRPSSGNTKNKTDSTSFITQFETSIAAHSHSETNNAVETSAEPFLPNASFSETVNKYPAANISFNLRETVPCDSSSADNWPEILQRKFTKKAVCPKRKSTTSSVDMALDLSVAKRQMNQNNLTSSSNSVMKPAKLTKKSAKKGK